MRTDSPNELISNILCNEDLELIRIFNTGNSGAIVLHTHNKYHEEFVLKIALNNRSKQEIDKNEMGYKAIKKAGLDSLLPTQYEIRTYDGVKYLKMNYLGKSFLERTKIDENPFELYKILVNKLNPIYGSSTNKSDAGEEFLIRMRKILQKNYNEFLMPARIVTKDDVKEYINKHIEKEAKKHCCFAVFDFTPEDVYLSADGIKYPDATDKIEGIPIIDLACFGGVARDVYNLEGSTHGYEILENYAILKVAKILSLPVDNAQKLFYYGRALQLSLSSRFRIEKEPEKAKILAKQSLNYLIMCNK